MLMFCPQKGADFAKRGFGAYFSNSYFDEIAAATCAALPLSRAGHVFPVRRTCTSSSKETCDQVCQNPGILKQTSWNNKYDWFVFDFLIIIAHRTLHILLCSI